MNVLRLTISKFVMMSLCMFLLFSACLSFTTTEALGAQYYVSKSGSDSNSGTTLSSPFRTPQKAADVVSAGDTVYIRAGTYGGFRIISKHGQSGNLITFRPYNSETVIIDSYENNYANSYHTITLMSSSYINIKNLKVTDSNPLYDTVNYEQGQGRNGIKITWTNDLTSSHHIKLVNNEVYRTGGHAIVIDLLSRFNEIIGNNVHDVGMGKGYGTNGHGLYVRGDDNIIRSNTIDNCYSFGIHVWSSNTANWPDRNLIERNIVSNCGHSNSYDTQGSGILVGAEGKCESNVIQNNISFKNVRHGILIAYKAKNSNIINNTVYNNGNFGIYLNGSTSYTTVRNNISYGNYWNNYREEPSVMNTTNTNNLFSGNPKFIGASSGNFRLQSSSPAIDTGTSAKAPSYDIAGTSRPKGAGDDIGAFEFAGFQSTSSSSTFSSLPSNGIMDNGSKWTSKTGTWQSSGGANPYGGGSLYSENSGSYEYCASGVNGNKGVYLWWTQYDNRCTSVPVEIYDGSTLHKTVYVNHKENGGKWNYLGTYSFNGKARVVVRSQVGGTTSADACKITAAGSTSYPILPSNGIMDNGSKWTSKTGTWQSSGGANPYGGGSLYSKNSGSYEYCASSVNGNKGVYLWWTQYDNRCTSVPVEIYDGNTLRKTVYVNHKKNGGKWNYLGAYSFNGKARVVVRSPGGGTTSADACKIAGSTSNPILPSNGIMDNGSQWTSKIGTWKSSDGANPYGGGSLYSEYNGSYEYCASGVNGNKGVYLWWTQYDNRCTSVPVEIYDGNNLRETVYVNHKKNGGKWNYLGTYSFSGKARVVVHSQGGCTTCADAVRIQ